MSKKWNWEEEYKKVISGEYDELYNKLIEKYERGSQTIEMTEEERNGKIYDKERRDSITKMTKIEYKSYKEIKMIQNNISKVKNIIELREKLKEEKEEINKELERRKNAKNLDSEKEKLEKENADLLLEAEGIDKKLKDKELSNDERAKLESKKQENANKRKENNENFRINQDKMRDSIPEKQKDIMQKSDEELKLNKIGLETKIKKCNMACNNLMQGKSWEAVDVKLAKWDEKLTGKKGEVETMKKAEETVTTGEKVESKEKNIVKEETTKEEKVDAEKLPIEHKSFAEKHPRLAKIPFLAKIADRISRSKMKKKSEKDGKNIDKEMEETAVKMGAEVKDMLKDEKEAVKEEKDNDFRTYLREVAEKGLSGIEKEKEEARKAKLQERFEAMREKAQDSNRYQIDENGVKHDTFGQQADKGDAR